MKIGIVAPYFSPYIRGNEYGLAESLSSPGHKVTVFASTAKAPCEKKVADSENSDVYSDLSFSVKYFPTRVDFADNPIVSLEARALNDYDILMLQQKEPEDFVILSQLGTFLL